MATMLSGDIVDEFERAIQFVKDSKSKFSNKDKIKLHAFFKQAVEGDNNTDKPGYLHLAEKQKWNAWKELSGMGVEEAMMGYINLVSSVDPKFKMMDDEGSVAVNTEFAELPPVVPARVPADVETKEREIRTLSLASGTNPFDNALDNMRRIELYQRLSNYYKNVEKTRLTKGIGDVVDFAIKHGEEETDKRLTQKYGVGLSQFEAKESEEYVKRRTLQETISKEALKTFKNEDSKIKSLRKKLINFFYSVDPGRLERGVDDLINFSKKQGIDALNNRLYRKYGLNLNDDVNTRLMERKDTSSSGKPHPSPPPRDLVPHDNDSKNDSTELNVDKLHEFDLPDYVKDTLISFYSKYEPERLRRGDIRAIFEWAQRNGLRALNVKLKEKYNESLTEFRETSKRLRDELIAFYVKADKTKLVSGLDSILTWGLKNGRRALNGKLREKYGYDLDANKQPIDDIEF